MDSTRKTGLNDYQKQVRETETKEEYIARLDADRDQHYNKMDFDHEIIIAVKNRTRNDDGTFLVATFENDTEKNLQYLGEKTI